MFTNRISLFGGVVGGQQVGVLDGKNMPYIQIITKRGKESHYVRVFTDRSDLEPGTWVLCIGEPLIGRGMKTMVANEIRSLRKTGTKNQLRLTLKGGEVWEQQKNL